MLLGLAQGANGLKGARGVGTNGRALESGEGVGECGIRNGAKLGVGSESGEREGFQDELGEEVGLVRTVELSAETEEAVCERAMVIEAVLLEVTGEGEAVVDGVGGLGGEGGDGLMGGFGGGELGAESHHERATSAKAEAGEGFVGALERREDGEGVAGGFGGRGGIGVEEKVREIGMRAREVERVGRIGPRGSWASSAAAWRNAAAASAGETKMSAWPRFSQAAPR